MKTRLLHVSGNRFPPLPATHHTRRIWEELAQGFDEYHLVARGQANRYVYSHEGKLHLHLLPALGRRMWPFFFASWVLPWFVFRYRPTHLIAQCPVFGGLAAGVCARILRIPLFVELHGAYYFGPVRPGLLGALEHRAFRMLSRPAFALASRIRTLSDDMAANLERVYGRRTAAKQVVIPNRVDLAVFKHVKDDYSISAPVRIVTVGSYHPRKNHLALISDLHASGIAFRLTIVGAGPLRQQYMDRIDRLGIVDRVVLVENLSHNELSVILQQHDLYVHYATSEGVPRAILEAMAAGLPVISTPAGFIGGVLVDGENSIVLTRADRAELAGAVESLLASEVHRSRLGKAARADIEQRFEWNRVFQRYRDAVIGAPSR